MKRSIRMRLTVWVLAWLLPLSAGAGWLLVQVFGNRLLQDIDVALREEAETVGELLATGGGPEALSKLVAHIAAETDVGAAKYVVVTRNGQVLAAAPREADEVLRSGDPVLRVVHYHSPTPDGMITVSIAAPAAAALHAKQRLTSLLTIGVPLVLLLASSGLWALIGRALRPLESASRRLDDVAPDNLSVRVPVENPRDEVGRMVTVLNRMLDRLERTVLELQRFTADAAHELRTPLTVLRMGLDVALARERSAAEYRDALRDALASTDRMCRVAEDMLTLARLEATTVPQAAGAVDLGEVLQELADAATNAAGERGLNLQVTAVPGLLVRGNAGDLYRLFSNLIDNAIRHSDAGTPVELTAARGAHGLQVTVADRGPGIPPEELPRVFDRFYRGRSEPPDRSGTGLGLSIAQEIARTHGGQVCAGNREGGGCVMTVSLPAAA